MCGIFTLIKKQQKEISSTEKDKIFDYLHHRGPDGQGLWENNSALLMHTRLKIIDLDDHANQPFKSKDSRYIIIYNGECYNYKTIRKELESKGVLFRTNSDTEVLLEAFIYWGKDYIHKVAGMFSIVIYDIQENFFHVWRDRIGIKPLYVCNNNEGVFISSEIRPILLFERPRLNESAVWSYFNLRFTQGEQTLFKNIKEVSPGSYLFFKDYKLQKEEKYWDLRNYTPENYPLEKSSRDLRDVLDNVIREHNFADIEISSFLSGGIDSAVIAAYSSKNNFFPTTYTFSTGLKDDEGMKAKEIAEYLKLKNINIEVQQGDFKKYKQAVVALEDPIGDSIVLPTYMLTKMVANKFKVVLSGEGADEMFSGYIHHQLLTLEDKVYKKTPDFLWKMGGNLFNSLPVSFLDMFFPYPASLGVSGKNKVAGHFNHLEDELTRYVSLVGLFTDDESKRVFNFDSKPPQEMSDYWSSLGDLSFSDRIKRFDLYYWARNYTLHRLDRLSMINSVEARVPYFDHRLVELILKIKSADIYNFRDPKKFFRDAIPSGLLPEHVIRRKKQAFYLPIEKVFDEKWINNAKSRILDNLNRRSIFDKKNISKKLDRKTPELLDAKQLQALYNFELWCEEFVDS